MSVENGQASPAGTARISAVQGWLLVFALVALTVLLFWLDADPAPLAAREATPTMRFMPLARRANVVMMHSPTVGLDTAVFVGSLSPDDRSRLLAMDLSTGDLRWQVTGVDRSRPDLWPDEVNWVWPFDWRWGPVVRINDKVIVADVFGLATRVNGFDLNTGELVWQRSIGVINGSDVGYLALAPNETVAVRVAVEGYSNFQILDAESGYRQTQRQADAGAIFWIENEPRRVFEAFANQVRVTGEAPWQQSFSGCDALPFVVEEWVILQTFPCPADENRGPPGVTALSRLNGAVQWQRNDLIVSKIALDQDYIVGLTVQAELLVIDRMTGILLGALPFSQVLDLQNGANYFVAAHNGTIVVYFGDQMTLFVVQFQ